jgi:hypothetical protein
MFLKPTASVPSTVQAESVPDDGVPRTGVVKTGEVSVLFVSVCVLVAVSTLLGVIIPDKVVIFYSGCVGQLTVQGKPACAGT